MKRGKGIRQDGSVDRRIVAFIRKHHVLTLATVAGDRPWCANIFYSYMVDDNLFVFTTDLATRHGLEMERNPRVAASAVLETKAVGLIQGLQISGEASRPGGEELARARKAYLRRFPYAAAVKLELWTLRPTCLKLTDNLLGFGKKIIWGEP